MDELTRLLRAAQGGDRLALAAFIRRSQAEVWRLCAYLVDRQAADDLTQEVYLRAWTALPGWRREASARTWLLAIARRTCAQAIRRRLRHVIAPIEVAVGDQQVLPDPADAVLLIQLLADWIPSAVLPLSSPSCWACPMPRLPRSAAVRWAPSAPASHGPAATSPTSSATAARRRHWRTRRCPIRPAERALRSRPCDPHLPLQHLEDTTAPTIHPVGSRPAIRPDSAGRPSQVHLR
jgi:RNA polymerase sigma factor (sigma-70 family)